MKSSDLIEWPAAVSHGLEKGLEDNGLENSPLGDARIGCILTGIAHSDADKISPY